MSFFRSRGSALALLIFAAMGLFPPWLYTRHRSNVEQPAGYHLIFAPPAPERDFRSYGVRIDTGRLLIQWAALAAIVAAVAIWRERRGAAKEEEFLLDNPANDESRRWKR